METLRSESAAWVQDQFAALVQDPKLPPAVRMLQKSAFERFQELGVPTTRQEEWRYTNLTPVVKTRFFAPARPPHGTALNELLIARALPENEVAGRVVIVNGSFVEELSVLRNVPGLRVTTLGQSGAGEIAAGLQKERLFETEPFAALNTALLQDAISIHVEKGAALKAPLEIVSLIVADTEPVSCFPRIRIHVEREAAATVIERHLSVGKETFCTSLTEFEVEDAALLEHIFIQQIGAGASQVSMASGTIGRDAKFHSHVFQLGASLVRNEIRPVLAGVNGECLLNGITAISASQHVDNYTIIDHAAPHCYSREHYKGVYGDHSSGVFCGTIIVRQEAQKTNAVQSNQSLLLSPNATIDTKPQLKIWADDVKCTHGATVGQLDDDALFYLRARGIPAPLAKKMLVEAFVSEVVEALPVEVLKTQLLALLQHKLAEII